MPRTYLAMLLPLLVGASTPSPPAPPFSPLPPLRGEWLEPLGDLGFVSIPTGATDARPVVIAVHGAYDRPDWSCAEWRAVFGPRPFIVCPHGEARPGGVFLWRGSVPLRAAIDRALDAAAGVYWPYLDLSHRVYAGFSQGAILGAGVVKDDAKHYPYAVFQEGFGDELATRAYDDQLKRGGVRRVLLGCSQGGCAGRREPLLVALVRAGVDAHVNDAGPLGHTMEPRVLASLRSEVPWLLAGDPAWAAVAEEARLDPRHGIER